MNDNDKRAVNSRHGKRAAALDAYHKLVQDISETALCALALGMPAISQQLTQAAEGVEERIRLMR